MNFFRTYANVSKLIYLQIFLSKIVTTSIQAVGGSTFLEQNGQRSSGRQGKQKLKVEELNTANAAKKELRRSQRGIHKGCPLLV